MWKSFVYKDFEWTLHRGEDRPTLEIKAKGLSKQPTCIFTKQVSLFITVDYRELYMRTE